MGCDLVVGIDLGGTKIELGLVDPLDRIKGRRRMPTDQHEGPQAVVGRIAQGVAELERSLSGGERIAALGICSPGPLDHGTGMLIDPPNLPDLHNSPLRDMLADRLEVPVRLEHDAKAAALGDFYYGAGRGEKSMVYIVVGTGVGAAIIVDGELYRGEHNSAGEVGHITLDRDGEVCHCGSRGCAELQMSGPRLAHNYRQALEREGEGLPSKGERRVTGELVARLAAQGDPLARQVMENAGEALGLIVASMAMTLNVDLFVVGGSVAKSGDLLLEPARITVPKYSFRSVSSRVRIVATECGDDGPILGCGWLARQTLARSQ